MEQQRRVLVIANETVAGTAVVDEVRYRAGDSGATVLVVSPALITSRVGHFLNSATERARERAERRLEKSLEALRASGLDASGELGDSDPLQALDDAYRVFAPDEIVISTHPPARSHWLERKIVTKARERFPVPVTHVVVDLQHEASRTQYDPRPGPSIPKRTITLYRTEPYDAALNVRREGFRNSPDTEHQHLEFAAAAPVQRGDDAEVVFAVTIPEDVATQYEIPGNEGGRRFALPAELVNRHDPWVATSDWAE